MTKILPLRRFNIDDYKSAPDWFKTYLNNHNPIIDTINTLIQGNVDITNNMLAETQVIEVVSGVPISVELTKLDPALQRPVLVRAGFADGYVVAGANITGYNADGTVEVTVEISGSPTLSIPVVLVFEPVEITTTANSTVKPTFVNVPIVTPPPPPGDGGTPPTTPSNLIACSADFSSSLWEKYPNTSTVVLTSLGSGEWQVQFTTGNCFLNQNLNNNLGAINWLPNQQYTFAMEVKVPSTVVNFAFGWHDDSTTINSPDLVPTTTYQTFSFTFVTPATIQGLIGNHPNIAFQNDVANVAGTWTIKHPRLFEGSVDAGYSADTSCPSSGGGAGTRAYLVGMYISGGGELPVHPWLGYRPDCALTYQDHFAGGGFNSFGSATYPWCASVDVNNQGTSMDYAGVAAGSWDSQLRSTFNSALGMSNIYIITLDKEFNFGSAWSSAGPTTYKAALNHVIALGKTILPAHVKYAWNPNWSAGGDISAYVPDNCDLVLIDAYAQPAFSNSSSVVFGNRDGSSVATLWWWTRICQGLGKPLGLGEFGDDYKDGVYIADVGNWANNIVTGTWAGASANNNVKAVIYWNSNQSDDAAFNATSQSAFETAFANRTYSDTFFTHITPDTSLDSSGY